MSPEKLEQQQEEPEVYAAKIGCPYKLGDEKLTAWLEGYTAGLKAGGEIACQAIGDAAKESRDGAA